MLLSLLSNLDMGGGGTPVVAPPVEEPVRHHGGSSGKGRRGGKRPPYWWEAVYKELREVPLPQEEESNEVAQEVLARLQALWRDLDSREVKSKRMLAECERLEKLTAIYIQFHEYARLLSETRQRIMAAEDVRREREEASEINEIMDLL